MAKKVEAARNWAAEVECEVRELTQQQEKIKADMEDIQESHEAFIAQNTQDIKEAQDAIATLTGEQREKMAAILDNLGDIGRKQKDLYEATAQRMEEIMGTVTETINQSLKAFAPVVRAINETADKLRESAEIWALLGPYMKKETEEHPEIYGDDEHPDIGEDVPLEALIAAAAERARADGVDVPRLQAEDEMQRRQRINKAFERRSAAKESGALTEFKRLATIANKGLGFKYFTTEVLTVLPDDAKELLLDKETGEVNLYALMQTNGGNMPDVTSVNTGFLMFLLSIAAAADLREMNTAQKNTIVEINIPDALKKMNIDPRPQIWDATNKKLTRATEKEPAEIRFNCFMELLRPVLPIGAYFGRDRGKLYAVASFIDYDPDTENIHITIPYMFALVEYAKLHAGKHPAIVYLFHANIVNENPAAVEIASRIAIGVIYRGVTRSQADTYKNPNPRKPTKQKITVTKPDGTKITTENTYEPEQPDKTIEKTKELDDGSTLKVTIKPPKPKEILWDESFKSILRDCPQAQRELDRIKTEKGAKELAVIEAAEKAGIKPDPQKLADAHRADHKNDAQKRNNKLKDLFDAAIRIIQDKSDMPVYYADFQIGRKASTRGKIESYRAPTNSTMNDFLVIQHKGKDPDYVDPIR